MESLYCSESGEWVSLECMYESKVAEHMAALASSEVEEEWC